MANIYNETSNTILTGTSSEDEIYNGWESNSEWIKGGSFVTINAGAGNDTL